jgi:hypothetical protein
MLGFATLTQIGLVAALALAVAAHADDKKDAADPGKRLDTFVGAWDVVVKYKLPDGKEYEGKATCVAKRVLQDHFIQQEYQSMMNNQPMVIWQMLGYDTVQKKFVELDMHAHVGSAHTIHTDGAFSDDGKVLTLRGDSVDGFTSKPVKMRTVTTIKDHDNYTLEWFITDDSGKEERKVVLTHTRKK